MDDSRLNRILAAATDLFAVRGFGGTTVQDVADRANVSAGTIINYFKTKENLLFILTRHILESFYKQMYDISRKHDDPATALDEILRSLIRFDLLDKNQLKIIFKTDVFLCLNTNTFPFQDINMSIIRCKNLIEYLVKRSIKNNGANSISTHDMELIVGSLFIGLGRLLAVDEFDLTVGNDFFNTLLKCLGLRYNHD